MNRWLIVLLVLVAVVAANVYLLERGPSSVTYLGVLPGADCAGLKTELTLFRNHTYFLRETYLATKDGDITYTSTGKWQTVRPAKSEIIQLILGKPGEFYNFLKKDADHLLVVGQDMRPIDSPMNLMLTRQK